MASVKWPSVVVFCGLAVAGDAAAGQLDATAPGRQARASAAASPWQSYSVVALPVPVAPALPPAVVSADEPSPPASVSREHAFATAVIAAFEPARVSPASRGPLLWAPVPS